MSKQAEKESFLSKVGDIVLSFLKRFGIVMASVFGIFVSVILIKKIDHHLQIKDEEKKEKIKNNIEEIKTKTEEAKNEVSEIKEEVKEEIVKAEEKIEEIKTDHDNYVKEQQKTAEKAGFKKKNK